ncbi:glycosyltransferase [Mucilaginibacter myungsuensis]|uniref:Glycosyltransferase n=1 Tax=Mucilaginibacter myungsuensis TaxID=649104 RepID=A0A929KY40_9SPHI|nr:glycosyltransferase [Mucilaginibacter myungsuensis]MBE9660750.1 glycosyltransferase [Mucilaginibacter myungsuensis]MDN3600795.1 glycosyltransferase [Mucilaginibacter myungsuensis]
MKLSVLIVNQNDCARLKQALFAINRSCEDIDHEFFVIDNASDDNSVSMVEQHFPQVKLIVNDKDLGVSKAANQALNIARGEYTLILDPDTITKKHTIAKAIEFMDQHPTAGGTTVRLTDPMGNFLKESQRGLMPGWVTFFKLTGLSKMLSRSRLYDRHHEFWIDEFENTEIDIINPSFMLLRRKVLLETGFMDERFTTYGHNVDLSYRIRLAGFKNYYFAKIYAISFKDRSYKFSWDFIKNYYGAMLIFAGKYIFKLPRLQFKLKEAGPILKPSYEVER